MNQNLLFNDPVESKFQENLKNWVEELKKIKFSINERKKIELILNLIIKFVFIQSLDNFSVIKKNFIYNKWAEIEQNWKKKEKLEFLKKYLGDIDEFLMVLFDTDKFLKSNIIIGYIEHNSDNINQFYQKFKELLGVEFELTTKESFSGIIHFNFSHIDQDILGKIYETYLEGKRKKRGIYYTPNFITKYIVENTVGTLFEDILRKIEFAIDNKDFESLQSHIKKFLDIKILDPACGSGSFLISALRITWNKYKKLNAVIERICYETSNSNNELVLKKHQNEFISIDQFRKFLNFKDKRNNISKILIRHIYGNDPDKNAIEIAKLNLWLEIIKLSSIDFLHQKFTSESSFIFPNLDINLINGDSLIDFPNGSISAYLKQEYKQDLTKINTLRNKYLENPLQNSLPKDIIQLKNKIIIKILPKFKTYLKKNKISEKLMRKLNPIFWQIEFWHVYFKKNLKIKPKNERGFDIIIGNPPYIPWNKIGESRIFFECGIYENCHYDCRPNHPDSQPNIYLFFIIKAIHLLKYKGKMAFILPQEWLFSHHSLAFRNYVINSTGDIYNLKFHPYYRVFHTEELIGTNSLILFLNKYVGKTYFEFQLNETEDSKIQNFLKNYSIENIFNSEIRDFEIEKNAIDKNKLIGKRWEFYSEFFRILKNNLENPIFKKLSNKEYFIVFGGFQPPIEVSKKFCISKIQRNSFNKAENQYAYRCIYAASKIQRYYLEKQDNFWIILNDKFDNSEDLRENCPNIYEILDHCIKEKENKWWEFPNVRNLELFLNSNNKLLIARTSNCNSFALDTKKHIIKGTNTALVSLILNIKYCLGILNSKLANYFYQEYGYSYHGGTTRKYEPQKVKKYMIPIKNVSLGKQQIVSNLVDELNHLISEKVKMREKKGVSDIEIDENIRKIDNLIDLHVFKLYNLNLDNIKYILDYLNTPESFKREIMTLYNTL